MPRRPSAIAFVLASLSLVLASSAAGHGDHGSVITGHPPQTTTSTSATFTFEGSPAVCTLKGPNSQTDAGCTSPKEYSGLSPGEHKFEVRSLAGRDEYEWTIERPARPPDTAPPRATITSGPSGTVRSSEATFRFSSSESGSTFACRLDESAFVPCTSPRTYSRLSDGSHTFAVRATDAAGNTGDPAVRSWRIDTTAPAATITSGPSGAVASRTATFTFLSSEQGSSFQCRLDGANFSSCASPRTYAGLGDGTHTFAVRATDAAGNAGQAAVRTWTVDATGPTVTIGTGPSGVVAARTAAFTFSSSEPGSRFACQVDVGEFTPCSSPWSYANLAEGRHRFAVRATDARGNTGATAVRVWTIDATGPALLLPAAITVEAASPAGAGVVFSVSATDGKSPLPQQRVTCTPPSGSTFPLGMTPVACQASDGRGNTSAGVFSVNVLDRTPPVLTVPANIQVAATSAAGLAASDPSLAEFMAAAKASDIADPAPVITSDAPAVFAVGQTKVTFKASDRSGNSSVKAATVTVAPARTPARQPTVADRTPPGDVRTLVVKAGNRRVTLRWTPPVDADFHHVVVLRSRSSRAAVAVYRGSARRFQDRRLRNGVRYRYLVVAYDNAGNRSAGIARVASPKARLLLTPAENARVSRPPLLTWLRVRNASYYNVQLFRGGRKILSSWPREPRLRLQAAWLYKGRRHRLAPGLYRWYVWPGFGPRARVKYGTLVGESAFVVAPRKP